VTNMSPAPGTPQTADKAKAAGVISAVGTGVATFVGIWVADTDPFTAKEIAAALVASVVTSGVLGTLTGIVTYKTPNKPA
jgi:hypothetical protein